MRRITTLRTAVVPLDSIQPHPANPRRGDVQRIARSLQAHGLYRPLVVQQSTGHVLAGNHTWQAAAHLGWKRITVVKVDVDDDQARRILLVDNAAADAATYDTDALTALLADIGRSADRLEGTGYGPDDLARLLAPQVAAQPDQPDQHLGSLAAEFGWPPFSVVDTRQGPWLDRNRYWRTLGIRPEVGREHADGAYDTAPTNPVSAKILDMQGGLSLFDPTLCELVYRWYCPPGGLILDPFAGGPVRGIVAGQLGYRYRGIDLLPEQVEANRRNTAELPWPACTERPTWDCADAAQALTGRKAPGLADLLFSCPPYYDLEVYSDQPADLSHMSPDDFDQAHADIIGKAVSRLHPDRFAVWVVGDVRDPDGYPRNLARKTIDAFTAAGARWHDELILVKPAGTAPLRAGTPMRTNRRLTRVHQHALVFLKDHAAHDRALVFVKGTPRKAAKAVNPPDTPPSKPRKDKPA